MQEVAKAWGAKLSQSEDLKTFTLVKKKFKVTFQPVKDSSVLKDNTLYVDTLSLSAVTGLRIEWFPEHNALVLEER